MATYIVDLETDGLLDAVTRVHCIVARNTDDGKVSCFYDHTPQGFGQEVDDRWRKGSIAEGLAFLAGHRWVGHNLLAYDIPVLRKLGLGPVPVLPLEWPDEVDVPDAPILDTLVLSRLIWTEIKALDYANAKTWGLPSKLYGSHSLEAWGHRLGVLKGDFGKQEKWDVFTLDMLTYCVQDTAVTMALYERINKKRWPAKSIVLEHQFADAIDRQEKRGVEFNMEAADKLCQQLMIRRAEIETEIQACPTFQRFEIHYVTPKKKEKKVKFVEFNARSRDHLAKALMDRCGWSPKDFTESGKPEVTETVLEKLDFPGVKLLLEHFKTQKVLAMLAEGKTAWMKLVDKDGRIHGRVNHNGAGSGRSTHSRPNLTQVPKVVTKKVKIPAVSAGAVYHQPGETLPPVGYVPPIAFTERVESRPVLGYAGGYGWECRSLFGPKSRRRRMVGCDAKGLELRTLAHFLAKYDGGEYVTIVTTGDPHEANRVAMVLDTRDKAKTTIYAILYGAGGEKIGLTIGGSKKDGEALIERFFKARPAFSLLRRDMENALIRRGQGNRYMAYGKMRFRAKPGAFLIGLDGRQLVVRSSHSMLSILNQSAGALVMKVATVIMHRKCAARGWECPMVLHVHDEFQFDVEAERADEYGRMAVESIKEAGVWLGLRCPLDGDYKVGQTWAETH